MKKLDGSISWGVFQLDYSAISDRGRVRKENEDGFLVMEDHRMFCVADGMGGQENGKLASRTTLDSIVRGMNYLYDSEDATIPYGLTADMLKKPLLTSITQFANFQVHNMAAGRTMGSTLVAAHFTKNGMDIAHVGDSRLYLWRNGQLTQITEDHSLVYELYRMGKITQEEMQAHSMRNVITRAIGINAEVEPSLDHIEVLSGDIYLICSDGLTTMLETKEIIRIFDEHADLKDLARVLTAEANEAGGRDNITVLLISAQQNT